MREKAAKSGVLVHVDDEKQAFMLEFDLETFWRERGERKRKGSDG